MTNVLKYKSRRNDHGINKDRHGQTIRKVKRQMRRLLRRAFKKANDDSGAVISGTYWI